MNFKVFKDEEAGFSESQWKLQKLQLAGDTSNNMKDGEAVSVSKSGKASAHYCVNSEYWKPW